MKKIICLLFAGVTLSFSSQWSTAILPSNVSSYLYETGFVSSGGLKYFLTTGYDSISGAYKVYLVSGSGSSWSRNSAPVEQLSASEYFDGGGHNIAVGKNGNIHVLYVTGNYATSTYLYDLKYAKWNGSVWSSTTVVSNSTDYLYEPAIAVNTTDDMAHLVYSSGTSILLYTNTQKLSTASSAETVTGAYSYDGCPVSLDSLGNVIIGAGSNTGGIGVYKKSGSWAEAGKISGNPYYFALVTSGRLVYVPFDDYTNEDVKCGVLNGSASAIVDVDAGMPKVGNYIQGAVDSKGTVHLVYYDYSFDDLKYARSSPSGWTVQVLDSSGKVGRNPAICIGQDDSIHILYYDETNYQTKYTYASATSTVTSAAIPPDVTLINNVFKPLKNENVEVKVDVNSAGVLKISLYSPQNKLIKVLADEVKDAGKYSFYWNGSNSDGETIASGFYFVVIENGGARLTKKVVVVK